MSSSSAQIRQYKISDIPQEVLQIIFKFLSKNQRKTVKLVCKSWFEACNVFSLLNDEFIDYHGLGIGKLPDMYELFNRSQRRFLSLKFTYVKFNIDSSFWENNGHKIQSIDFEDCNFLNGTLEKIIIYCVNLVHLSFTYTVSFSEEYQGWESPINKTDLDNVLKIGIVRENLNSLKIYVAYPDRFNLSNYIINQLFSIFPKVKFLKFKCINSSGEPPGNVDLYLSQFCNEKRFTFSPVFNYLKAATNRIEKLRLHFPWIQFPLNVLHPIFTAMTRLTELTMNMGMCLLPEDIDLLILYLKQLKWLEFYLIYVEKDLLIIRWPSAKKPYINFPAILRFSLKYLKIRCPRLDRQDRDEVTIAIFRKLISSDSPTVIPSLSLHLYDVIDYYPLTYFQYMERFSISDHILKLLFKYQLKLKRWIVGRSRHYFSIIFQDYFDISMNPFNKLADIEYLDLLLPVGDLFVRCLSSEPILANLKCLNIEISDEDQLVVGAFPSELLKAADAMPFLEDLRITYYKSVVSFDFCVELCSKLSRLLFFVYTGDWLVGDGFCMDENYRELFSICPSLRALVHINNRNEAPKTYLFDTINKEVRLKQISETVFFSKPICDLSVAWLEFL